MYVLPIFLSNTNQIAPIGGKMQGQIEEIEMQIGKAEPSIKKIELPLLLIKLRVDYIETWLARLERRVKALEEIND